MRRQSTKRSKGLVFFGGPVGDEKYDTPRCNVGKAMNHPRVITIGWDSNHWVV